MMGSGEHHVMGGDIDGKSHSDMRQKGSVEGGKLSEVLYSEVMALHVKVVLQLIEINQI